MPTPTTRNPVAGSVTTRPPSSSPVTSGRRSGSSITPPAARPTDSPINRVHGPRLPGRSRLRGRPGPRPVPPFLQGELAAGRLGHDRGESLRSTIGRHGRATANARHHTRALSAALSAAQNAISAVHGPISPPRSDEVAENVAAPEGAASPAAELATADFPAPIADAL